MDTDHASVSMLQDVIISALHLSRSLSLESNLDKKLSLQDGQQTLMSPDPLGDHPKILRPIYMSTTVLYFSVNQIKFRTTFMQNVNTAIFATRLYYDYVRNTAINLSSYTHAT